MNKKNPTKEALLRENQELRARLGEAEETLQAIREGQVDAVVVSGSRGDQIFSLVGTDVIYRLIVETMKEAAFTVGFDGTILFCNSQFGQLVRRPQEQIVGRSLQEFVQVSQREAACLLLTTSQQRPVKQRMVFQAADGTAVPAHISANLLNQPDGLSICIVATDLTDLENSTELIQQLACRQEELREAARFNEALLDTAGGLVIVLDTQGRILRFNHACERATGYAAQEVLGRIFWEFLIPQEEMAGVEAVWNRLKAGDFPNQHENHWVGKDGRRRLIAWANTAIAAPDGTISYMIGTGLDITERTAAQEALQTNLQRFYAVLSGMYSSILLVSQDDRVEFANQAFCDLYGLKESPEELAGLTAAQMNEKIRGAYQHPEEAIERIEEMVRQRQPVKGEEVTLRGQITCLRDFVPLNVGGAPYGRLWQHMDITQRTRAEEELRRLNRTLKALGHSSQAMLRAQREKEYLDQVCKIIVEDCGHAMVWIGYAQDDQAKSVHPVAYSGFEEGYLETLGITWADTERGRGPTGTAIRTGEPAFCRNMLTDPHFAPWREQAYRRGYASSISLPLMSEGKAFGALTVYFREPDPFTPDEVRLLTELADDLAHGITALRLREAHKLIEESLRFLIQVGTGPGEDFFQSLARYLGQNLGMDYVCIDRLEEGSLTARTVAVYFDGKFEDNVSYALKDTPCGKVVEKKVCCFAKDVRHLFPNDQVLQDMGAESYAGTLLRNSQGTPIGLIAVLGRKPLASPELVTSILQLVAVRAASELERQEAQQTLHHTVEQLARSNEDLQQFAYIASHDLQEPLRMVTGFLNLLRDRYQDKLDAKAQEYIAFSCDGANRMSSLIRDLLEFSRAGSGGLAPAGVDFAGVVEKARVNLRLAIEESRAVIACEPMPTVTADAGQMTRVFQNLIGNALKFRAADRRCEIHIDARQTDGEWLFRVQDNGIGIDPAQAERIFLIFQRLHTRGKYEGTGIGLAICKKIIERHGGRIWVESSPGQGSTFCFTLPTNIAPKS